MVSVLSVSIYANDGNICHWNKCNKECSISSRKDHLVAAIAVDPRHNITSDYCAA